MQRVTLAAFTGLLFSALFGGVVVAQEAGSDEPTILTLITAENEVIGELTETDLLKFDQVTIWTENEFVDGMAEFTGPLVRDVLKLYDDDAEMSETAAEEMAVDDERIYIMTAVNEYSVEIPAEDFVKYDVIFAMSQDGEKFSLRTKGPIWVIYPMSDHSEIRDRMLNDRLIWQLASVAIK